MDTPNSSARRIALQHVRTTKLLGVDFLPGPRGGIEPTHAPAAAPEPAFVAAPGPIAGAKHDLLAALRARHDAECPHCTQATGHTRTVFSDGDPDARLMIIGEAPGAEEDKQGIPFVGRSGELLNQMLAAIGMQRTEVYIANVLKARPPNNDTPTGEEAARCGPYLKEQIAIVRPQVILTMGNPATQYVLDTKQGITSLRGSWQSYGEIAVMPTFHPAYLLRNYTQDNRKKVWSDLKAVAARLKESSSMR